MVFLGDSNSAIIRDRSPVPVDNHCFDCYQIPKKSWYWDKNQVGSRLSLFDVIKICIFRSKIRFFEPTKMHKIVCDPANFSSLKQDYNWRQSDAYNDCVKMIVSDKISSIGRQTGKIFANQSQYRIWKKVLRRIQSDQLQTRMTLCWHKASFWHLIKERILQKAALKHLTQERYY